MYGCGVYLCSLNYHKLAAFHRSLHSILFMVISLCKTSTFPTVLPFRLPLFTRLRAAIFCQAICQMLRLRAGSTSAITSVSHLSSCFYRCQPQTYHPCNLKLLSTCDLRVERIIWAVSDRCPVMILKQKDKGLECFHLLIY